MECVIKSLMPDKQDFQRECPSTVMFYLPAPDKIRLVGHQDDWLVSDDLHLGEVGQHHLRREQRLSVVHGHHHQHRIRIIDMKLTLQRHFPVLVINEE